MSDFSSDFVAHIRDDGTRQTVTDHCRGTAELAAKFAAAFDAEAQGRTAGLLHDIGKYSTEFQTRISDPAHSGLVDHSTAGAQVALRSGLMPVAYAVAGHHAGLPDGGARTDTGAAPTLVGRAQKSIPECGVWRQELALPPCPLPSYLNKNGFTDSFFIRMLYSCLVDADYLDTERFMQPQTAAARTAYDAIPELLHRLHHKTDGWLNVPPATPLNEKRNIILRACLEHGRHWPRGLYTLTVPTGGGKTVASLAFALEHAAALGMTRVVYIIPYTSIIDQTVDEFGKILGEENVLAHHGGADYRLKEESELTSEDYRRALSAENWDAPVIVTTAVQFFESLYANRSSRCRKLHNLANSVLIFDEAQTLPIPYLRPCAAAIAQLVQHYHATAVLCTATQPALGPLFEEFAPTHPLREICPGGAALYESLRRVTLEEEGPLTAEALTTQLCGQKQVLCVVNRRAMAQQLYAALPSEGRYCLTTLLCAHDRRKKLAEIRTRLASGLPCRVISTSLIEAGVDVDFPAAYRERAGLDSILQTAGRCNREGRHSPQQSIVRIFTLADAPPPAMLAQNLAALTAAGRAGAALDLPETIERYFTLLLTLKGKQALDRKEILRAFTESRRGVQMPFAAVAAEFHLIESPTRSIYLPIGKGADLCERLQRGERSRSLFRALGPYSVSVYPKHFDALYNTGALVLPDEETAILSDLRQYNPDTGLTMAQEGGQANFI